MGMLTPSYIIAVIVITLIIMRIVRVILVIRVIVGVYSIAHFRAVGLMLSSLLSSNPASQGQAARKTSHIW